MKLDTTTTGLRLTTTADVLNWARCYANGESADHCTMKEAARLAYAMRVLALVEAGGTDLDTYSGIILDEASAEKGDK